MTIISSGIYPIDPTITDGTQLAGYINELVEAINSQQASSTRPPMITKGGLWTKTLTGSDIAVMVYDGTNDVEIGKVSGGEIIIGGTVWTEPTDSTAEYVSKNDTASIVQVGCGSKLNKMIQYASGESYFKGDGITYLGNESDENILITRNNKNKIVVTDDTVQFHNKIVALNGIEGGSVIARKYSMEFAQDTTSTNWVTIPRSTVNYASKRFNSHHVLELTGRATTHLVAGVNQYIKVRWLRNGTEQLGSVATFQISSGAGGLQGMGMLSPLPYVYKKTDLLNNTYQVQVQIYNAGSTCSLIGRMSVTEYAEGVIEQEPASFGIEEEPQVFEISDEEKADHIRQMKEYETKMKKAQSLLKEKKKKKK